MVDAASPQRDEQIFEVNKVLAEIGAAAIPTILVYNKIDRAGLEREWSATPMVRLREYL